MLSIVALLLTSPATLGGASDLALVGGRVIDPASGFDAIATVVVRGDRIEKITTDDVEAATRIDCTGLVVSPGFVDVLVTMPAAHDAQALKAQDGVTTVLGMHGGPTDVTGWFAAHARVGPLLNHGFAVGHGALRFAAGALDRYGPVTDAQLRAMREQAATCIEAGAVGVGFGINYTPGADYDEIVALFEVAAAHDVPAHVHSRYKGSIFPENILLSVQEVVAAAAVSGASAQIVHLTSSAVGSLEKALHLVDGARAHGVDVGFDIYPYNANMTRLDSAIYDEGWQARFGGISFEDVMVLETGERLTAETFPAWRERGAMVSAFFIPEKELHAALRHPAAMVASDGFVTESRGHPRGAGTFARLLGKYVREEKVLSLPDALAKVTILPARRLERAAPTMRQRGRISAGAFADVTVFDPNTVIDRATFQEPGRAAAGIRHVLVNGTFVLRDGALVDGATPGRPVTSRDR